MVGEANTWVKASAGVWSDDTAWSLGHKPTETEIGTFSDASVNNCSIDVNPNCYGIAILAGYTGTVTQGAVNIGIGAGGYSQAAGTFTGLDTKTITVAGNIAQTAGTITDGTTFFIMTGNGTTVQQTGTYLGSLRLSANVTTAGACFVYRFALDDGKTFTANHDFTIRAVISYSNSGTIAGGGKVYFTLTSNDRTIDFGVINCQVGLVTSSTSAASKTITLSANTNLGSALTVQSAHATNTITLATSTYTLTCGALTLGARGVITQGTGALTCASYTQNGASSVFTQGGPVSVAGDTAISDGTLTGLATSTWTQGGNWTTTGTPTITRDKLQLTMSGEGKTLTYPATSNWRKLTVTGTCAIVNSGEVYNQGLVVSGALTIPASKLITDYSGTLSSITGVLAGSGKWVWSNPTALPSALNNVSCTIQINQYGPTSKTLTMTRDWTTYGPILVDSTTDPQTMTLDTAGFALQHRGLTVGTRGNILFRASKVTGYGNLDTSAGAADFGTSQYVQAAPGTIKTAANQPFNDLILRAGAAGSSLLSNVTVNGIYAHVPELAVGAFTLTKNGAEYTGKRRPIKKQLVKRMVWPSAADQALLEDIERVSA
jgi:hypothetical protein